MTDQSLQEAIPASARQAIEHLPTPLCLCLFPAGRRQQVLVSDCLLELLGASRGAFTAQRLQNPERLACREDQAALSLAIHTCMETPGSRLTLMMRLVRDDGSFVSVRCWGSSEQYADGMALWLFLKESMAAEQNRRIEALNARLRQEVVEYDMLMESTGVGILKVKLDEAYTVEWCNEAALRLAEYSREQFEAAFGRSLKQYLAKESGQLQHLQEMVQAALDHRHRHFDISVKLPTRTAAVYTRGAVTFVDPDADRRPTAMYMVFTDITGNVENQQKLEKAKLEAEQANEAKSTFLSSMSHDLRTPLNGVLGFTDIALHEQDPAKVHACLEKIHASGALLLDLVNDTLDLSRIESGKMTLNPAAVSEQQLVTELLDAIRPSAELKGIQLEKKPFAYAPETVWADRLQLQKIFLNLLSNAVKYTPAGGRVTLLAEKLEPPVNGCTRRITVSDTGIGMSEEFQKRMFEPFAQEDRPEARSTSGTGLGLAIVRRIVDLMSGSIHAVSRIGEGTSFIVELPLRAVSSENAAAPAEKKHAESLAGLHALLCEDNQINAEVATIELKDQGMSVDWAVNGAVGVEKFERSSPGTYQVILMDVHMPVLGGLDAARKIRAMNRPDAKEIPIIAMTGNAFEKDVHDCLDAGMNAHLAKPVNPQSLFETIASQVNRSKNNTDL